MSHNIYFQRQHAWTLILVTIIMNFTHVSLLVSVTADSLQGMLGNFIKKDTSLNYKTKPLFVTGF